MKPAGFNPGHGEAAFRLVIPRLSLDEVVVEGADIPALALGIGHYATCRPGFPPPYCSPFEAPWPGEKGRVVIAGHRTIAPRPFFDLGRLSRGDEIFTATPWGTFRYVVTARRIVSPDDRTVIVDGIDKREVVLVTCHPKFSAAQRMIVYAELRAPPRHLPKRGSLLHV